MFHSLVTAFRNHEVISFSTHRVNTGIAPIQLLGRTFFSGPSKGEDKSTEETANNEDSGIPSSPNWKSRLLSILENNKVFTESDEWKKDISKSTPPPPKEKKPR